MPGTKKTKNPRRAGPEFPNLPRMDELTDEQWHLVQPLLEVKEAPRPFDPLDLPEFDCFAPLASSGYRPSASLDVPHPVRDMGLGTRGSGHRPSTLREPSTSLTLFGTWDSGHGAQGPGVGDREVKRGRPAHDDRLVLNGILFYIRNALTWINIPSEYPSYVTCFRRYHEWRESGVLEEVVFKLTRHMEEVSGLELIDAWKSRRLSLHIENGILTIYLPKEYSTYWMQPTAVLMLMWMYTRTMEAYREAYRRVCKETNRDRLVGEQGTRSIRPRIVECVVGVNPQVVKDKIDREKLDRERLDFIERMASKNISPH